MARAIQAEPCTVIKADRVDDQRVALPVADRVAKKRERRILQMGTIHVNPAYPGRVNTAAGISSDHDFFR